MATTTRQTVVPLWHYVCPTCNFDHSDLGYKVADDAIYCEVCLEDGAQVRLRRWPADDEKT